MKQTFKVTGMGCGACVAAVERAVKGLEGITSVSVSLIENSMVAEYDETVLSSGAIIDSVKAAGYGAELFTEEPVKEEKSKKKLFF